MRHGPSPPLQVVLQGLGSKSPDIGRKMGRNESEDLFFFALHLILGEKWNEILVSQFQILIYVPLKFSEVSSPPPPFQNPAYATEWEHPTRAMYNR